ncbi:hypothetical protein GCG54_00012947 [Colletotrichum gloeosporioides]|uniref:DUF7779 domain-containing protein n=1 Tax=Colletotrichum gloeosporioides TaxID=474922 RepID=A0A8H4FQP1_COLGL|nr:uncharacterized protein GCG54_00012947 [Colletotrichum gloeosporioides]KAF3809659.1 hypothetical protein GCG54_00012947 [Colletotrichum gloeosporioides]
MPELDRKLYTVAWIAPLYIEARAALLMLDQRHPGQFPIPRGCGYVFHAGSIGGHNVIIATLPAGQEYGTASAAVLAAQVQSFFPNLWFGLLVGVAAGLPNLSCQPPRDIRLGDVLVALPLGDTPAIVPYDLGKDIGGDEFLLLRRGHTMAQTQTIVRSAIRRIQLDGSDESESFLQYYQQIRDKTHDGGDFSDPGQDKDVIYESDQQGIERRVTREPRSDRGRTRVWYGPIGSGDKLMRNSRRRNELRDKYNIIGLEMEAAGTMNCIPVGVIRGVCDYGDEHKNKEWQPYAAAMAAAYAKSVLRTIVPEDRERLSLMNIGKFSYDIRVYYVDASSKVTADSNFTDISRVCQVQHHWEGIPPDEQIRITRECLASHKDPWLLMIDNADSRDFNLDTYIPTAGPGTILITTTDEGFATYGHASHRVGSMSEDEAISLLLKYTNPDNGHSNDQYPSADKSAKRLATEVLCGLPLAIAQAGSYISYHRSTYDEYLEEFGKCPRDLLNEDRHLMQRHHQHLPVWSTLALSIGRIEKLQDRGSTEAIELLRTMSFLHNEGIHDHLFREAWKNMKKFPSLSKYVTFLNPSTSRWNTPTIQAAFAILRRYSLITPVSLSKQQYSMHKIVQTICRELLTPTEQLEYSFKAASLTAVALSGIETPLSWIDDPSGFDSQKLL